MLLIGLVASTLWTLLGAGLALATASSIGSAVGIVAWYVVGEGTVRLVLSGLGLGTVAQWLPGSVTLTAFAAVVDDSITPGWPQCLVALALWAAASCGLGWWATGAPRHRLIRYRPIRGLGAPDMTVGGPDYR